MKLTCLAFESGGKIPAKHAGRKGVSPPFEISDVPDEAKSLVLIMDDPDVPKSLREDGMWDHWIVFNMPPRVRQIAEGVQPEGIPGKGTDQNLDYFGPAPPDREHRYFFKLYALDTFLDLGRGATKAEVEEAMNGHVLATAEVMGRYAPAGFGP